MKKNTHPTNDMPQSHFPQPEVPVDVAWDSMQSMLDLEMPVTPAPSQTPNQLAQGGRFVGIPAKLWYYMLFIGGAVVLVAALLYWALHSHDLANPSPTKVPGPAINQPVGDTVPDNLLPATDTFAQSNTLEHSGNQSNRTGMAALDGKSGNSQSAASAITPAQLQVSPDASIRPSGKTMALHAKQGNGNSTMGKRDVFTSKKPASAETTRQAIVDAVEPSVVRNSAKESRAQIHSKSPESIVNTASGEATPIDKDKPSTATPYKPTSAKTGVEIPDKSSESSGIADKVPPAASETDLPSPGKPSSTGVVGPSSASKPNSFGKSPQRKWLNTGLLARTYMEVAIAPGFAMRFQKSWLLDPAIGANLNLEWRLPAIEAGIGSGVGYWQLGNYYACRENYTIRDSIPVDSLTIWQVVVKDTFRLGTETVKSRYISVPLYVAKYFNEDQTIGFGVNLGVVASFLTGKKSSISWETGFKNATLVSSEKPTNSLSDFLLTAQLSPAVRFRMGQNMSAIVEPSLFYSLNPLYSKGNASGNRFGYGFSIGFAYRFVHDGK